MHYQSTTHYIGSNFYDRVDIEGKDAIQLLCEQTCTSLEEKALGGVKYTTYTFEDHSSITFGDNGYLGCEYPS